jgi:hypothetical protein
MEKAGTVCYNKMSDTAGNHPAEKNQKAIIPTNP